MSRSLAGIRGTLDEYKKLETCTEVQLFVSMTQQEDIEIRENIM